MQGESTLRVGMMRVGDSSLVTRLTPVSDGSLSMEWLLGECTTAVICIGDLSGQIALDESQSEPPCKDVSPPNSGYS